MTMTASPALTQATLSGALELSQRALFMERALRHYEGFPRKQLQTRVGEVDDNTTVSPLRLVIDKSVSFLFGQPLPITLEGGQPAAQDWLDLALDANRSTVTWQKLATNGSLYGHAFARLLPTQPFPRLIVLDNRQVEILADDDDLDHINSFIINYPLAQGEPDGPAPQPRRTVITNQSGQAGYRVDLPERWEITDQVQQGGAWLTTASQLWPWPWCPVQHCQNLPSPNSTLGAPDAPENVLHLCDVINRVSSHINKILRIHGHPLVFTKGMGQRTIDRSIDSIVHLPSTEADMKVLEMQSDLSAALAYYDKLLGMLAAQARTPLIALGMKEDEGLGPISGVALRIRYGPLLDKTQSKRELYGYLLREVCGHMLEIGGYGADLPVTLQWNDSLPSDELADAQTWVLWESLGLVSKQTLAARAGLDWDTESEQIATERAAEPAPVVPPPAALGAPNPDVAQGAPEDR